MTTQGQHQTANLKNVRRYFSRPEWMKDDHKEPTEEPETPIETIDHIDKDEGTATNKRPLLLKEITEIFKGPTSNRSGKVSLLELQSKHFGAENGYPELSRKYGKRRRQWKQRL
jgi:hypothetical protein